MFRVLEVGGVQGRIAEAGKSLYKSKACVNMGREDSEVFNMQVYFLEKDALSSWLFNIQVDLKHRWSWKKRRK